MRPQLRDDVRFVECPDGAYVHSDYGACTLRGRQAYAWLTRLAPALTGHHTLAELTASLPADRKTMVERLVGQLAEQRFVVDARHPRPHGLTEAELRAYAEEIAFIGYALDSPEERFERIRHARLALVGAGPLLEALAAACIGSGWRHVTVITPGPEQSGSERAGFEWAGFERAGSERVRRVADAARRDPAQEVRTLPFSRDLRTIAENADIVLQVSADLDELVAAARAGEAAGIVLGQALVGPAEVWIGPVGRPSETAAESGWHRLAGLPAATPAPPDDDLLTGPVPMVVAAILALACFSRVTGLDPGPERELVRVDLRTLDTLPHRFLPHPRAIATRPQRAALEPVGELTEALTEALTARRPAAPAQAAAPHPATPAMPAEAAVPAVAEKAVAAVEADGLLALTAELVDSRLGVLGTLDEQALTQSPVAVCQAVVSDPFGVLPGWAPARQAVGWGPDQRTARLRCLLAALATYGAPALDHPDGEGVVWGVSLPDGRPRTVPTTALGLPGRPPRPTAPAAAFGGGSEERPPVGTGAGLSWAEALAAGLRAHCEDLLRDHLSNAPQAATLPAPIDPPHDPEAEALSRQLALAGEAPDVHDLTAVLGVPAVALMVPGQEAQVSVAATLPDALRDGLERLLLRWQSRAPGQHVYARPHPLWAPDGDPAQAVRAMAGALRRAGKAPVAVPLHADPEVSRLLPFVVRIVLLDD
ncbi:YcaO-like family protein [[Actinomadura] parvosata]|uniref:YcaO-like family protein n=1 Tax=[Actinomadura] parvosata TaxID=1955412 RepID=UPI00406CE5DD